MTLPEGQGLGRYKIMSMIGEGGMATVYMANDVRLERQVAIKIIRREVLKQDELNNVLMRFKREVKALARLSHPNIVSIHDFGSYQGAPYLVMPYISGGTLKQHIGIPMPWSDAARLLAPVARALSYAHAQNVIHRDIKPSNVLLTQSGEPMLTDFGIAKLLDIHEGSTLTDSGMVIGTPDYMAPEQSQGAPIDGRVDIYALGIVFYELITGQRPFRGETPLAVMLKHTTEPLPSPKLFISDLPNNVEAVIYTALAKQPEYRYAEMSSLAAALENLVLEYKRTAKTTPLGGERGAGWPGGASILPAPIRAAWLSAEEQTNKKAADMHQLHEALTIAVSSENWGLAEQLIGQMETLGLAANEVEQLRTQAQQAQSETRRLKLRIGRLEKTIADALEGEDFEFADELIGSLTELEPFSQDSAERMRSEVEAARQLARQREERLEHISSELETAITHENFVRAEALLEKMMQLGPKVQANYDRSKASLENAQARVKQRHLNNTRLAAAAQSVPHTGLPLERRQPGTQGPPPVIQPPAHAGRAARIKRLAWAAALLLGLTLIAGLTWLGVARLVLAGSQTNATATAPIAAAQFPAATLSPSPFPSFTAAPTLQPTNTATATPPPHIPLIVEALFQSMATPNPAAAFGQLAFAQAVDQNNQPVQPALSFQNPVGALYVAFNFDHMENGNQWTALWYRGSELIYYVTEIWEKGSRGAAYTLWVPEPHQWRPGEYEVQFYVGLEWKITGRFSVTGEAPTPLPFTVTSTATPSPTTTDTATSEPSPSPTSETLPTATSQPIPTATFQPLPTATSQPLPTATSQPLPTTTPAPTQPPPPTNTWTPPPP